jgi:hypothetical protein
MYRFHGYFLVTIPRQNRRLVDGHLLAAVEGQAVADMPSTSVQVDITLLIVDEGLENIYKLICYLRVTSE